ncbi:MAG: PAS domain S-box protein [Nitrospirae bacterium]|nr:PAS domain S-box protein [Nitrospirota bacterium]
MEIESHNFVNTAILENIATGVWVADENDVVYYANKGMSNIAGIPVSEIIGKHVLTEFYEETLKYYLKAKQEQSVVPYNDIPVKTPSLKPTCISGKLIPVMVDDSYKGMICTVEDVTEHKQAIESEERYRAFVELANDAIFVANAETGIIVDVNKKAEELSGYSRDEIIGMHQRQLHPIKDLVENEKFSEAFKKHVGKRITRADESNIIRKDGTILNVSISASVIYIGKEKLILGIFRDITEQNAIEDIVKQELAFQSSVARVTEALLNSNNDKYMISKIVHDESLILTDSEHGYASLIDENGDNVAINLTDMMGNVCKVAKEKQSARFPKGPDGYNAMWGHSLNNGESFFTNKPNEHKSYKGCTPPGHVEITNFLSVAVKSGSRIIGQIALANSSRDYTQRDLSVIERFASIYAVAIERKEIENKLAESEERCRSLFEKSPDSIFIADTQTGCIVDANTQASILMGRPVTEIKGIHQSQLHPKSMEQYSIDSFKEYARISLHDKNSHRVDNYVVRSDGKEIPVEILAQTIHINGNPFLLGVFRDISERKHMEDELHRFNNELHCRVEQETEKRRAQEQMLIQQSKMASMGEMIGLIAHQWKQPLNAVGLTIQDLKDSYNYGELDAGYIESIVDSTLRQVKFMSKTIDDFRNFFVTSKKKILFDVKSAIEELLSMFIHIFNRSNIDISVKSEQNVLLITDGYANEFKQVVLNIINNSKDAIVLRKRNIPEMQGLIEINTSSTEDKSKVIVSIKDNGGGIAADVITKIFEPYFTTKGTEGTRLGLYMSKTIIETNMGGTLTVKNVDNGAEFLIILNAAE